MRCRSPPPLLGCGLHATRDMRGRHIPLGACRGRNSGGYNKLIAWLGSTPGSGRIVVPRREDPILHLPNRKSTVLDLYLGCPGT